MTRSSTILIWFSLTLFVSLGLYHTSYRVEELDRQLRGLNTQIETEQKNIHVLKAEWVYLANPARIEEAARKHLELQPTSPTQVTRLSKISQLVPMRSASGTQTASANTHAIANLRQRHAAHKPKIATSETGRINTHLIFRKTAQDSYAQPTSLRLVKDETVALADPGTVQ
ncbi:MAG: cell division protein FtsL [Bdellovibrionales bacterium]